MNRKTIKISEKRQITIHQLLLQGDRARTQHQLFSKLLSDDHSWKGVSGGFSAACARLYEEDRWVILRGRHSRQCLANLGNHVALRWARLITWDQVCKVREPVADLLFDVFV